MRSTWSPRLTALAVHFFAAAMPAQVVPLVARGGSYPGTLQWILGPGQPAKQCTIILSVSPGPTPLAPIDPRSLSVGLESLGLSVVGFYDPTRGNLHHWPATPLSVPANPAFDGATIFAQGLDFPGRGRTLGAISDPAVSRLGPKGRFRDRGARLKTPRTFGSVFDIGHGQWMVTGGNRGGVLFPIPLLTSEIYDAVRDRWVPGPGMNAVHTLHRATRLLDGRTLVTGGLDLHQAPQNTSEIFDLKTRTFRLTAPMIGKRAAHSAVLLRRGPHRGKVLVLGGFSQPAGGGNFLSAVLSAVRTTELWDPKTGRWSPGPRMTVPRLMFDVWERPDGKLLILGGVGWTPLGPIKVPTIFRDVDVYDPNTNTISKGAPMLTPRGGFAFGELPDGRLLVAGGGETLLNLGSPVDKCEVYDPKTDRWTSTARMTEPRAFCTMFALPDGRRMVIGGFKGSLVSPISLRSTDIHDPRTGAWSKGPDMGVDLAGYGWFVTPMGQIQIVGGQGNQGANVVARPHTLMFYP